MVSSSAKTPVQRAANSRPVEVLARVGYAVNGLLHALIGALAIAVALGAGQDADQSGALAALASTTGGGLLLWVVVIGLGALGIWHLLQTVLVRGAGTRRRWMARLKEAGKAIAYLALAATAARFATGGRSDSEQETEDFTAALLRQPFGVVLLLAVALLIVGIGVYFGVKGIRKEFLDDIRTPTGAAGEATVIVGMVGYVAKGISLVVVGILFAVAALTADTERAGGLDDALKTLAELPFGAAVLVAVGAGLIAYGVYCAVRARRARL